MPSTSSFDITSTIDFQEVDNALNQARKEVGQRYDFKGAKADVDLSTAEKTLTLTTDDPQPDKLQVRIWVGDDARRSTATTVLSVVQPPARSATSVAFTSSTCTPTSTRGS